MGGVDYYKVLGLNRGASDGEIKNSYRKNALKWHPDRNTGDRVVAMQKFSQISEAFEVLSNKKRRAVFDKFGEDGLKGMKGYSFNGDAFAVFDRFFGTANPFASILNSAPSTEVDDPFGELSGGASLQVKAKVGTVTSKLSLTLEEMYTGCTKRLKISRKRVQGDARSVRREDKYLAIKVQPGWRKGTKVTFENEGDEVPGHIPADVVFIIGEKPHANFKRVGNDLVYRANLSLLEALTDVTLELKHLDGRTLSVPCNEIVRPGSKKTLVGQGMPISKSPGKFGDLVVEFNVEFPKRLTMKQKSDIRKVLVKGV